MLVLLYLLAAFSGETRPAPAVRPAAAPHALTACAVVTRADVEAAIRQRVNAGSEEVESLTSTCDYRTKTALVSITVQRLMAQPDLRVEMAALKKEVPEATVRKAADFEQAFYFDVPGAGTQLHVIDNGARHLMVSVLGLGEATQVSAAAAQLARKALQRM